VLVYPDWAKRQDQWEDAVANRRVELEEALVTRVNKRNGPGSILLATGEHAGKTLEQVARQSGVPFEKVLIDQFGYGGPLAAHRVMSEETQDVFIANEDVALSTDGGPWISHPRSWGSAPELLVRFVRDEKLLSLETAIHKLSALPASFLGLADRGRIERGLAADINVIDLGRLENKATWTVHDQPPIGFRAVIVNGILAFDGEKVIEGRAGRALRRQESGQ
jgi:N-acyl-D-aspartate/D-glutamate deacylase